MKKKKILIVMVEQFKHEGMLARELPILRINGIGPDASGNLVLDAAVRDWVLLPLTLSVLLMMVLRQYMTKVHSRALYH